MEIPIIKEISQTVNEAFGQVKGAIKLEGPSYDVQAERLVQDYISRDGKWLAKSIVNRPNEFPLVVGEFTATGRRGLYFLYLPGFLLEYQRWMKGFEAPNSKLDGVGMQVAFTRSSMAGCRFVGQAILRTLLTSEVIKILYNSGCQGLSKSFAVSRLLLAPYLAKTVESFKLPRYSAQLIGLLLPVPLIGAAAHSSNKQAVSAYEGIFSDDAAKNTVDISLFFVRRAATASLLYAAEKWASSYFKGLFWKLKLQAQPTIEAVMEGPVKAIRSLLQNLPGWKGLVEFLTPPRDVDERLERSLNQNHCPLTKPTPPGYRVTLMQMGSVGVGSAVVGGAVAGMSRDPQLTFYAWVAAQFLLKRVLTLGYLRDLVWEYWSVNI